MRWLHFIVVLLLALPAHAQDIEGSKDHPRIPRMPGYVIREYVHHDFGKAEFYEAEDQSVEIEGKYWQITYEIAEGKKVAGPLEISRNYRAAFEKLGGGFNESTMDTSGGYSYGWLKNEKSGPLWLAVDVSNQGEIYMLTIVQQKPLNAVIEIGADEIAKALETEGRISLYGINFEFAKATITPDSAKTIGAIAETLKSHPALNIEIQGHTDNVGTAEVNSKLSHARANAVRDALVGQHGIEASRLSATGFGDTKPLVANDTDENRAKNRRVELVKKP